MRVIGTAGHVDHGKSTLVTRLTGIDPDRLAEEKAREMTIDLGFAWLLLPNGETLGIVDVPGHRDFIENMLAGIGGIDAVLLVIAADEGLMPQTREHLAILDLLGVTHGVVAMTKIDMLDDPDWLDLIEADIRSALVLTGLAAAPILRVSARTSAGIPALLDTLYQLVAALPPRMRFHHPRLPVDRVFSVSGFGTVVTGTLLGGALHIGDEIELQPSGLSGRVRGLHSYNTPVETAQPGSRVAVNISGVERKQVRRGDVVSQRGRLQPTTLIDAHFRHLAEASRPLKHDSQVKLFVGAAESLAYVRLLNDETLPPNAEGWLQIRLETPIAVTQGDRFILRYPSPSETIGGGLIVNANPAHRWRRFRPEVIQDLQTRLLGTPAQRVAQAADNAEPVKRAHLQQTTGYSADELSAALQAALDENLLVTLPDGAYLETGRWNTWHDKLITLVRDFHSANPLRLGIGREELRSRLGVKQAFFTALIESQPHIIAHAERVRLADHTIRFSAEQTAAVEQLRRALQAAPYTPPSFQEAAQVVGNDVLYALVDLGEIVLVQADVIFSTAAYREMVAGVQELLDAHGEVTAALLRDRFQTSRKYAIGLLEHLDTLGATRRVGDKRLRGNARLTPE